jgi:murein DD-endopeptidase MepM/ murein hydrolase activator NlpD
VVHGFAVGPHAWSPGHRGVDLAAVPGADILAAADGVVAFAGRLAGRAVVAIQHTGAIRTTYEPVDASVRVGAHVAAGQLIGRLEPAASHCAPSTCLHWGAIVGDRYVDPLSLLPRRAPPRLLPLWTAVQ